MLGECHNQLDHQDVHAHCHFAAHINDSLETQGVGSDLGEETVLRLDKSQQTFTFTEVAERPVISTLRGFSAPVKLEIVGQTEEDLVFLLGHDSDSFSRWEAGQVLQRSLLLKLYNAALDASKVCSRTDQNDLCMPFLFPGRGVGSVKWMTIRDFNEHAKRSFRLHHSRRSSLKVAIAVTALVVRAQVWRSVWQRQEVCRNRSPRPSGFCWKTRSWTLH